MKPKKKRVILILDSRIEFYRRSMVGILIMGLIAGAGILCGKSNLIPGDAANRHQEGLKVLLCLSVAVIGIATGNAYRRRIRHLKEHRTRILLYRNDESAFPGPSGENTIFEMQALFGILFFLAAVVSYTGYPIPCLPDFLDNGILRMVPIIIFVGLCRISVGLERKNLFVNLNPVQDFVEMHQKQARLNKPEISPVSWIYSEGFQKSRASTQQVSRTLRL